MNVELTWKEWERWLASAVEAGKAAGMGRRDIVASARRIGDLLARQVDPANPQQRLLQQLWSVADEGEQQAIASALVKLVDRHEGGRGERREGREGFTLS